MLSREAVGFLQGHLVPKEMALWESLGETWTRPRCGGSSGQGGVGRAPGLGEGWEPAEVGPVPMGGPGSPQDLPPPDQSGHGSRRCPSTCLSSTAAGSHPWTCSRRLPGKWRGWRLPPTMRSEHSRPHPRRAFPSSTTAHRLSPLLSTALTPHQAQVVLFPHSRLP